MIEPGEAQTLVGVGTARSSLFCDSQGFKITTQRTFLIDRRECSRWNFNRWWSHQCGSGGTCTPKLGSSDETATPLSHRALGRRGSHLYVRDRHAKLFALPKEGGFQLAEQVDQHSRAICLTTTLEHAELKQDQIHAYGQDPRNPRCQGSMSASIEPADE